MAPKKGAEVKVGIFLVVSIAAFLVVVITLTSKTQMFKETHTLRTTFSNISGLLAGAEVRLSGINVGVVDEIRFSDKPGDTTVFVTMSIEQPGMKRITKDSKAVIQSSGLLGKKFVEVLPGNIDSGQVADGDYIEGVDPVSMTEALEKGGKILDDIGKVASHLEEIFASVKGEQGKQTDLSMAITNLRKILEEVESGSGVLHALIYDKGKAKIVTDLVASAANVRKVTEEITTGDGTLHELIYGTKGKELVTNLASATDSLDKVVKEIQTGKGVIHSLIYEEDKVELINELRRTAENLRIVSERIQRGEGTIGALLVDPTIYEDIKKITGDVERSTILKAYIRYTIRKAESENQEIKREEETWGDREG